MATYDKTALEQVVLKFLGEHFYLGEGSFEPVVESSVLGNLRKHWVHYRIDNVEVALLSGDAKDSRFAPQYNLAASLGDVGNETCFIEIFAPNFHISTVVVLTPVSRPSRLHPAVLIRTSTQSSLEHFKFAGELRTALAYFTFAKLAK